MKTCLIVVVRYKKKKKKKRIQVWTRFELTRDLLCLMLVVVIHSLVRLSNLTTTT